MNLIERLANQHFFSKIFKRKEAQLMFFYQFMFSSNPKNNFIAFL
jgi:hypothetical protein